MVKKFSQTKNEAIDISNFELEIKCDKCGKNMVKSTPLSFVCLTCGNNLAFAINSDALLEVKKDFKNSGLGIAAFVMSSVVLVCGIALFIAGAVVSEGGYDKEPAVIIIILLLFLCGFFSILPLGLGIGGLFQKQRKKIFAILGTILSAIPLIIFGLFVLQVIF